MVSWSVVVMAPIVLLVALAGCLDEGEGNIESDDGSGPQNQDAGDGDPSGTDNATAEAWNATLEEAPPWQTGKWWDVRLTENFSGATHDGTVVVAGSEDEWYLTGMPQDDFVDPLVLLHLPALGMIRKGDLAWDVHDAMFQPVQFPLRMGDTWDTTWSAQEVQADVIDVSGTQAEIEFTGDNNHFTLVYDAEVGTIVTMRVPGYGVMEVVDHGDGYEGTVTVPYEHELILFHGRLAGVVGVGHQNMEPHPPVETITIEGDYDRVSFGLLMFALMPGAYAVDATAPDGTQYTGQLVATEPEVVQLTFHTNDEPTGDWETAFVAGGVGLALIEGVGYQVLEFNLSAKGDDADGEPTD